MATPHSNGLMMSRSSVKSSKGSLRHNRKTKKNYVADTEFKNVSLKMAKFKLTFDDSRHEKVFRWHYYTKSKTVVRICICGLILIAAIVFILDFFVYRYEPVKYIKYIYYDYPCTLFITLYYDDI